ncbi:hypothetical protein [Paenibacillus radicibacter]|uniref:hypothetical protein n=1 Tax=Paenibacillus radicibacter TaxID=2972488 RepID=UPI002159B54D|nr:hypothetical protein [Paenibacillus radicibacter]
MAEYYLERNMIKRGAVDPPRSRKNKKITWTNSEGQNFYEPHEMTSKHLLSCLHLCERREGYKGEGFLNHAPTYRAMVLELIERDILAYDYFQKSIKERLDVFF